MSYKQYFVQFAVVLAIVTGVTGVFYFLAASDTAEIATQKTLEVTHAIQHIAPPRAVRVEEGTTALHVLRAEAEEAHVVVSEKEYPGLGMLVTSIGEFENGDGERYWTYYVNGTLAPVGAGAYVLKTGDSIEWKFEKAPDM